MNTPMPDRVPTLPHALADLIAATPRPSRPALLAALTDQEGPRRADRVWQAAVKVGARRAELARAQAGRPPGKAPGRRPVGEPSGRARGQSRAASTRLGVGQLEALDGLAARLVSTRNEQMRRAVRDLLADPPPLDEVPRRAPPTGGGVGPQFVWIPEPGQRAALVAMADAGPGRALSVTSLIRWAVTALLAAETGQGRR